MAALAFLRVLTDVNRDHKTGPYSGDLREFCDNCWWPLSYQHFFYFCCFSLLLCVLHCRQCHLVNSDKIFFLQFSCSLTNFMHFLFR